MVGFYLKGLSIGKHNKSYPMEKKAADYENLRQNVIRLIYL